MTDKTQGDAELEAMRNDPDVNTQDPGPPTTAATLDSMAERIYARRRAKGMTDEQARAKSRPAKPAEASTASAGAATLDPQTIWDTHNARAKAHANAAMGKVPKPDEDAE
jgi:hypothetical protein